MGRPKGSKKKAEAAEVDSKVTSSNPAVKQNKPETAEVFAVSVLESPLLLCRSCRDSFETSEVSSTFNNNSDETVSINSLLQEYAQHQCPAQTYTVAIENEIEDEQELVKSNNEIEEVQKEKPSKRSRKPYKKRERKVAEEKEKASKGPVQCPTCKKSFTRKYHLERHLVHTSCNPGTYEREEFACEVCDKKFSRVDNLRMHLRAHLGQKQRSRDFQCPFCEKSFYGSSLLNIHVRTHTSKLCS